MALMDYLRSRPQVRSIEFNSGGGSFQEALKIADLVRNRGLATFVRNECLSACTLAYSAGKPRIATANAKFGFHRAAASALTSSAEIEAANRDYAEALRSSGVDERFIDQALKIEQPRIWIPGNNDLKVSGFVGFFVE